MHAEPLHRALNERDRLRRDLVPLVRVRWPHAVREVGVAARVFAVRMPPT